MRLVTLKAACRWLISLGLLYFTVTIIGRSHLQQNYGNKSVRIDIGKHSKDIFINTNDKIKRAIDEKNKKSERISFVPRKYELYKDFVRDPWNFNVTNLNPGKDHIGQELYDNRYKQVIQDERNNHDKHGSKGGEEAAKDMPFTEREMKEIEKEMSLRNAQVSRICAQNGIGGNVKSGRKIKYPPTPNYDVLYIDVPDAFTWCPVYKAASTSWLNILCNLAGVKESTLKKAKEQISLTARRLYPPLEYDDAEKVVPYTTKFMIVRHPFHRIVSAYRDKLENINIGREHGVLHFYEKYGKKIVKKYRKEEPVRRVNEEQGLDKPVGVEPTFREFVEYLVDTDLVLYADDHWIPYYLYCTPCYISYDVIAKFETLERDQKYLLQKINLNERIHPKWKHLTKGLKTSQVVQRYMNTLDKNLILKLAEKYEIDFKMYNYTYHQFL